MSWLLVTSCASFFNVSMYVLYMQYTYICMHQRIPHFHWWIFCGIDLWKLLKWLVIDRSNLEIFVAAMLKSVSSAGTEYIFHLKSIWKFLYRVFNSIPANTTWMKKMRLPNVYPLENFNMHILLVLKGLRLSFVNRNVILVCAVYFDTTNRM